MKRNKIIIEHSQGVLSLFENPEGYPDKKPDKVKLCPGGWFANWKTHFFFLTLENTTCFPLSPMERTWPWRVAHLGASLSWVKAALASSLIGCLDQTPKEKKKKDTQRWGCCVLLWRFLKCKKHNKT